MDSYHPFWQSRKVVNKNFKKTMAGLYAVSTVGVEKPKIIVPNKVVPNLTKVIY